MADMAGGHQIVAVADRVVPRPAWLPRLMVTLSRMMLSAPITSFSGEALRRAHLQFAAEDGMRKDFRARTDLRIAADHDMGMKLSRHRRARHSRPRRIGPDLDSEPSRAPSSISAVG